MNDVPECLNNISPKWASILRQYDMEDIVENMFELNNINNAYEKDDDEHLPHDLPTLDIDQFASCIVGEAYHLTNVYEHNANHEGCDECTQIAQKFPQIMGSIAFEEEDEIVMVDTIQEFCDHVKENHKELIKNEC